MKLRMTTEPFPSQWLEVDQQDYIVEKVVRDLDAPRRIMRMGGGPFGEDIAMPTQWIVTLRPITAAEEEGRRLEYAKLYPEGQSPLRGISKWGANLRRTLTGQ